MHAVRNALIIGGGIGGLSAAIALAKLGIKTEVAEIHQDWKVYHIGIVVQANFIRAMTALGIADQAVAVGYPFGHVTFQDLHGNHLKTLQSDRLAGPNYPARLGLTRPALHKVLFDAAREAGAQIRQGTSFTHIEQDDTAVHVTFTDGTRGEYDIVIGADGIYSQVRAHLFGTEHQPRFTGQGTWRYNVARPPELTHAINCRGVGLPFGTCGFIPLTQSTGYIWLVQAEPGNPRHPQDQLANIFRDRLNGCTGMVARLRDQIVDASQVVYRPLESLSLPPPWYRGRVILIGDAVHATTPHLGQGSAQAVEDAVVLGELLARNASLPALFDEFMQRRYERCRFIVESSLKIGEWEQHPERAGDAMALTARMLEVVAAPI
ncbi:MAG: FAD-dependent oxidoreductase [Steroidobacteraceae bacterium]